MSREFIIVANWKMHKKMAEALLFVETLALEIPLSQEDRSKIIITAPFTALGALQEFIAKKQLPFLIAAQNMHDELQGAFTGEISAPMLKELGVGFVILGHSERRHLFFESEAVVHKKVKRALSEGLRPILCIGEEKGQTQLVLERQLYSALEQVKSLQGIILAYEPVWAIGTGNAPEPEMVQEVHKFCRERLAERWGEEEAKEVPILYGGSVNEKNCAHFVKLPDVDGLLVGGASLEPKSFSEIIVRAVK